MKMIQLLRIGVVSILLLGTNACTNSEAPSQEIPKSTPLNKSIAHRGLIKMMKSEKFFTDGTTFMDWSDSFGDIVQYSENDATMNVNFNIQDSYTRDKLKLKFTFKRTMNDTWIITGVEEIEGVGSQEMKNYIRKLNSLEVSCQ